MQYFLYKKLGSGKTQVKTINFKLNKRNNVQQSK